MGFCTLAVLEVFLRQGEHVHVAPPGMLHFPFMETSMQDYLRACQRAELHVTVVEWRHFLELRGSLQRLRVPVLLLLALGAEERVASGISRKFTNRS